MAQPCERSSVPLHHRSRGLRDIRAPGPGDARALVEPLSFSYLLRSPLPGQQLTVTRALFPKFRRLSWCRRRSAVP
eukprot:14506-Hanusia_phi.AAC.7